MTNKSILIDVLLNYFSLILGGISGIFINIYISYYYGPEGLGVFNQIYSIYVILSQFAVGGVHLSAFTHVATWKGSLITRRKIIWSALVLSFFLSCTFACIWYIFSFFLYKIFPSLQLVQGFCYLSLAFIFFSCNKVMLFILNALLAMRLFAFWQGVRFILLVSCVIGLSYISSESAATLTLTFTISEGILFTGLILTFLYKIPYVYKGLSLKWAKTHFSFGMRGIFNGLLLEVNTRVDILVLGFLTNNKIVGIYSFSSTLIEGVFGLLVVIRNQVNPLIANFLKLKQEENIKLLFKKISLYTYTFFSVVFIIFFLSYDYIFTNILNLSSFVESRSFFLILFFGVCVYSPYFIFENLLVLSGLPGKQSHLSFYMTLTNIIFNILLVPFWGAYGSALATALTLILNILYLKIMIGKNLRFSLNHI